MDDAHDGGGGGRASGSEEAADGSRRRSSEFSKFLNSPGDAEKTTNKDKIPFFLKSFSSSQSFCLLPRLLSCLHSPTSIPARRSFSLFFLRQNATHFSENEIFCHKFLDFNLFLIQKGVATFIYVYCIQF